MAQLPPGFVLDGAPQAQSTALPPGFQLDEPPQEQPGMLSQIGRQLGLTARYGVEGAGNLLGMVSDPFGQFLPGYQPTGQAASGLADSLGLPQPQGDLEQGVGNASRALVGTGLSAGAGLAAGAPQLAAQPLMQALGTMSGAGAQDIAKEAGAGPGVQAVAGLVGGLAPNAGTMAANGTRLALRGGEQGRQALENSIKEFAAAGTTTTVGQGTQNRFAQFLESLFNKVPGGTGVMAKNAERQQSQMGAKMAQYADELGQKTDPTRTGAAIERGIVGENGFVQRFKAKASELYDALDQHMPPETPVPLKATQSLLAKEVTPTKGAEATSSRWMSQFLKDTAADLKIDMAPDGSIPFSAAKELRSRVGAKLADSGLVSDIPKAELKRLYGSLSQDIRAQASTNPKALAAANRAENFYRSGLDRLDRIESVVNKNGGPEKIFLAATSGTKEGASTLRAVMQSLKKDEASMVTSAVIRRMGKANPGQQSDLADEFSTEKFLTGWASMSPEAKRTLFDRIGPDFSSNMDKIAAATNKIRQNNKVVPNASGSSQGIAQISTTTGLVTSLLTGNLGTAALIGSTVAGANLGARLMTNPKFVSWLAKQNRPISTLPGQIGVLSNIGKDDPDIQEFIASLNQQGNSLQQ